MAFDPIRLRLMAYTPASERGVDRRLWCYVDDDDTLESIQSPGFFNDPACNFGQGDWLLAQGTDGWIILTVMEATPTGEITLGQPTYPDATGVSQRQFRVLERRVERLRETVRRLAERLRDHRHDDDDDDDD